MPLARSQTFPPHRALLPRSADLGPIALLAIGYAALALFGLNWSVVPGAGTSVWPASGLALAALLLGGPRLWPGVLLGRLLTAVLVASPQPLWADLGIAIGSALGALAPVWLLGHRVDRDLGNLRDIAWLGLAAAAGGATISASIGGGMLWLSGTPTPRALMAAGNWWCGFAVGVLWIAPAILCWSSRASWRLSPGGWLLLIGMLLVVAGVSGLVFTDALVVPWRSWLLFPLLGLAAIAFGGRGASAAVLIVAGYALASAAGDVGLMSELASAPLDRVLDSQQFVATAALTTLVLAAVADERRRFEPAARLGAIVEASTEAIVSFDLGGRIGSWNGAAHALLGIDAARAMGRTMTELAAQAGVPLDPTLGPMLARVLGGQSLRAELTLYDGDGLPVPLAATATPVRGLDGSVVGAAALLRDLRPERAGEAARRASDERLRLVVRAGGIGCFDWDAAAGRAICSPEYLALHGLPLDTPSLDYAGWMALVHPDDRARVHGELRQAQDGGATVLENEHRIVRADGGGTRWLLNRSELHRGDDGRVLRVIGAQIDVTERKSAELALQRLNETLESTVAARTAELLRAEEALLQSQKMEALGQLTGGVAHDFNNLLTPIVGGLDMLRRRVADEPRAEKLVDGALASAERARVLVQRLLAFARRQVLRQEDVDLPAMVAGMADLIDRTLGPSIALLVDMPRDLPPARVDRNQLELALLNLCVNARDAMPDGGTLTIAAALDAQGDAPPMLRLSVRDTGTGMDAATVARCIEPFFSTKELGRGTGLGLSMVHGLVAQSGGRLEIDSAPGAGATVSMLLPTGGGAAVGDAVAHAVPSVARAARVLLVDDEPAVRAVTAEMLTRLGHEVASAGSAEEALVLLSADPAFDLLVTDHLMPGMTGAALVAEVARRHPMIAALLITGYVGAADVATGAMLPKPFLLGDLDAAVRAALSRAA